MAYKISGRVIKKFEPLTLPSKSGNSYTKQDLVIAVRKFDPYTGEPTDDESNTPKFSFFGDRINDLASVNVGDLVIIHFDISGRSFTKEDGKVEYFNDIRPMRLDKVCLGISSGSKTETAPLSFDSNSTSGQKTSVAELLDENTQKHPKTGKSDDELPF